MPAGGCWLLPVPQSKAETDEEVRFWAEHEAHADMLLISITTNSMICICPTYFHVLESIFHHFPPKKTALNPNSTLQSSTCGCCCFGTPPKRLERCVWCVVSHQAPPKCLRRVLCCGAQAVSGPKECPKVVSDGAVFEPQTEGRSERKKWRDRGDRRRRRGKCKSLGIFGERVVSFVEGFLCGFLILCVEKDVLSLPSFQF